MVEIGKVTGSRVGENRDGGENVRLLQIVLTDDNDVQEVELYQPAGVDSNPVNNSMVLVLPAGQAWKIVVAVNDGVEPMVGRGEYKIYSSADGTILASVYVNSDGETVINDGTDYAVAFEDLKIAFDQLQSDFDYAMQALNAHVHAVAGAPPSGPLPSPPVPGWPPGIQASTADIDPAKIEDVRVP